MMRVGVHRDAVIRVSHDVLQDFRIHSASRHVGAGGVAADVGRDLGKLVLISPGDLWLALLLCFL